MCNDVDLKKSQEAFEGAMLPSKGEKGDVWIANKVLDAGTFACVTKLTSSLLLPDGIDRQTLSFRQVHRLIFAREEGDPEDGSKIQNPKSTDELSLLLYSIY